MDSDNKKLFIFGFILVVVLIALAALTQETMEKDCMNKNGTYIRAGDPAHSLCIIPPAK